MNKIGFLYSMTKKSLRKQLNAFFDGLKSAHFVDGKDGLFQAIPAPAVLEDGHYPNNGG